MGIEGEITMEEEDGSHSRSAAVAVSPPRLAVTALDLSSSIRCLMEFSSSPRDFSNWTKKNNRRNRQPIEIHGIDEEEREKATNFVLRPQWLQLILQVA
jgi:hypothetical protein